MAVAALWAISIFGMIVGPEGIAGASWCVMIALSFPLAILSGAVTSMGISPISSCIWYFALMIPNCFLWGYGSARILRIAQIIIRPTSIDCSVPTYPTTATENQTVEQVGGADSRQRPC
ncbi:hypothetical protein HNR46_001868 [Haloferula luteola]|uniref:Uncharacterized protein n=1 Tax=Haloferula luteola TaxID=595692 RepID=A0A840VCU6_9BACT|nr:hypothetical protein [Haloferula luteola]MBB5351629.1 hypothetical protein [Haloferula luteola]